MKAVITVIGKDMVGILAKVSAICADKGANILEVTQSIMQDMFAMIMMIDISGTSVPFSALSDELEALGSELGLKVHVMHEDVFNSMHRI
ncbi:MAG: ACT domain-containing protein [Clostridia bacterium]|nr:ACT domain-containing protein [Clostridia bacterium]